MPSEDEIKAHVSDDTFGKFLKFNLDRLVMTHKDYLYCSNPECQNVLISTKNKIKCDDCKWETCTLCKQKSHFGKCADGLQEWLSSKSKRDVNNCPNCTSLVERLKG